MKKIDPQSWKADMPLFREKAIAYSKGEIKKAEYKGFSGRYGSYAQHDPSKNMLRLRMPAGRVTAKKLAYIAESIRKYQVPRAHFTTCQTIQLHDMDAVSTCDIMEGALDVGIVTMGGGGDFPRNTMCAPLSGVQKGEYFDVLPYAEAVGEFAMNFINADPMPRKLKVGFSNSPENVTHATFRDMGYAARPDGKFDIYTAGGLGNNPRFGVKVADRQNENIEMLSYEEGRQIVSEETSATMRMILEQVVESGSGKVGGKTATSQTLPRGTGRYIASFIGFAPADDPEVLAIAIIHNPQGIYYGGQVAAPVVRQLFENVLPYLDKMDYN